jgi:cbb3-type cytochrome oxidase maturation protein
VAEFLFLIPIALGLGLAGLWAFLWSLRSGQYEDLDGAAARILLDDEPIAELLPTNEHEEK